MKVVYWAWVIMVKLCVHKLENVRVLAGLNVGDQAVSYRVRSCKRLSILFGHTRCVKESFDDILCVADVQNDSHERRLLNNQVNILLRTIGHLERILSLEAFIADREMLWHFRVSAS